MIDLILSNITDFIKGISLQSWIIIVVVLIGLYVLSHVVGTILKPITQLVSTVFMLFVMYRFALMFGWL